jgi:competence protein ComEC
MQAVGARHWMEDDPLVEPLRFRRLPMMAAATCFALGEILPHPQQTFYLTAALVLCFTLACISIAHTPRIASLPVLTLFIITGCWCAQIQPPIPTQQSLLSYADGLSRNVRGRIERVRTLTAIPANDGSPQQPWQMEPGAWETSHDPATESVDISVQDVEYLTPDISVMRPVTGGARITLDGTAPTLTCGDIIELPLRLRVPETYRDPGAWSNADYLLAQGIGVQSSAKASRLRIIGNQSASWQCHLFAAQAWAANRLNTFVASRANHTLPHLLQLDTQDVVMLNAMLFGDRTGLTQTLRAGFERTGTFHLFVVSGLHITLIAGALFWILRRLGLPNALAVTLTLLLATAFALLTGFGVPVQRALGMTAAYLIARCFARRSNPLNALGIAALAVLAYAPRALFQPSFQMTFLVILAIAGIAVPLDEWLLTAHRRVLHNPDLLRLDAFVHPRIAARRVRLRSFSTLLAAAFNKHLRPIPLWLLRLALWFAEAVLFGIVIELCMVVPMAIYFHRATLLALPANILAVPLVITLLCTAVAMFCLSLLNTWLAMLPGAAVALLLHTMRAIVGHLGHAALADLRVPSPSAIAITLACIAIALCCYSLRLRKHRWLGLIALALIPLAVLWPEKPLLHPNLLEVTAIDVGQGDSILVVSPDGHTMLVDAGGPVGQQVHSPNQWDVGEEVVAPYLWSRHIARLDVVMLTHAHSDHMGGIPAVLRDFRPRELWLSVIPGRAPGLHALIAEAHQLNIRIRWFRSGDAFQWHNMQATVLSPQPGYSNPGTAINDDSLVMRLAFQRASVLLEGDAESPSEREMLAHHFLLQSTLLKVGHHGSITSSTPAFLAAVSPRDAVISDGLGNTFGHPRFEVLQRLEQAQVRTFRTDLNGAETFLLTPTGGILSEPAASN